jgi:hypothetical protein
MNFVSPRIMPVAIFVQEFRDVVGCCKISSFRASKQNNSRIRNNPVLRPASKYRIVRVSYSSPGRQLCSKLSALICWSIPESLLLLCWWFGWWSDPAWEVFGQIKPIVVVITTKFCRKCQRCCQGISVKCKLSGWAANENFTIGVIFTTIIHDHLPSTDMTSRIVDNSRLCPFLFHTGLVLCMFLSRKSTACPSLSNHQTKSIYSRCATCPAFPLAKINYCLRYTIENDECEIWDIKSLQHRCYKLNY